MIKKFFGIVAATVIAATSIPLSSATVKAESTDKNYAEALQKSLYFYECQQAGPLPDWNEVEWRADSTMEDYVLGGWYDAGDHVKFNLPMAYSASMLAWGLYQYKDGIEKGGLLEMYSNNLTFVLDYLAECDKGDTFVWQVGNGTADHSWWGPVELVEYGMADQNCKPRDYIEGRNASACSGEMAAALAAGYLALDGIVDDTTRENYLSHAENLFSMADEDKSDDDYQASNAQGFYSSSHFYDELFYASNWLYKATGEQKYLDKAKSYIPNLGKETGSDELKYSWSQCWDDVQQGGMLLYAQNTGDSTYIARVKKHLDYWTYDVQQLDGGLRWLTTWGCLRYATTAAFIASVACDTVLKDTDTSDYVDFYETQINYCLGDNPDNRAYEVGYSENSPHNVHHRTAHCSWCNSYTGDDPNRHTLYGALVGGPNQDGTYEDSRGNYINNEVACDYNAGFTAILGKMIEEYGGTKDESFPPAEERTQEFYVEAAVKQTSDSGVSLSLKFTNKTAWPARYEDNMSYRYYMDLSEVVAAGKNPEDVVVRIDRDQALMYSDYKAAEVSGLKKYKDNIYYIEVTYPDGRVAMPISEGQYQCELMLALVFPDYGSGWDSTNDFSFKDLEGLESTESVITDYIPIYQNGVLIYGEEPDGTTTPTRVTEKENPVKSGSSSNTEKETEATTEKSTTTVTTVATTQKTTITTTTKENITTTLKTTESVTEEVTHSAETEAVSTQATIDSSLTYGDVNADSDVTISDVVLLNKYLVKSAELSDIGKKNSDCYLDGNINSQDSLMILKSLVQAIESLPVIAE